MSTILIVEDDKSMREAIGLLLKFEGYDIHMAENGKKAIEKLSDVQPNLILLDMVMPEMNGWEFAETYHKSFDKCAPIIVITGAADPDQRGRDIQAVGVIEKPYEIEELLNLVRTHIQ